MLIFKPFRNFQKNLQAKIFAHNTVTKVEKLFVLSKMIYPEDLSSIRQVDSFWLSPQRQSWARIFKRLKVPKREIFDRSDFPDFYTIKSLRVGDFGVKIKKNLQNF